MNPCKCKSLYDCACHLATSSQDDDPLTTLANAAITSSKASSSKSLSSTRPRSVTPPQPSQKRRKRQQRVSRQDIDLPPIMAEHSETVPEFETIPSFGAVRALAGSGCTCGLECTCPGCVEHRGIENASLDSRECADGECTTCIDHNAGIELPTLSSSSRTVEPVNGVLVSQFLARAAALPLPASGRKVGVEIDPGNILVYPPDVFNGTDDKGIAFGFVKVPKLECCGGRCGCEAGNCSCGSLCDGSCQAHRSTPVVEKRSCCAGK